MTLAADFADAYLVRLQSALQVIDRDEIGALIERLDACRKRDGTIYFAGNGGKAALASEWVNDLTVALPITNVYPFRAQSIMCNSASLTAAANDFGYDLALWNILVRQLRRGDMLVVMSGSGDSANVLEAIGAARSWECDVVGIGRGGRLRGLVDLFVNIPADEDGHTEDSMMAVLHACHAFFKLGDDVTG